MSYQLPLVTALFVQAIFQTYCWGADIGPSEQLIRKEFTEGRPGTALQVKSRGDLVTVEVCFDQCDVYQWRGIPHFHEAWDFIVAYEYKKGVASESEAFIAAAKLSAFDAAKRMSAHCKESASGNQPSFDCSWKPLAISRSIRVGATKYDEGQRCFAWVDLSSTALPTKWRCGPIRQSPWGKSKS
jgi:hypothetical protein